MLGLVFKTNEQGDELLLVFKTNKQGDELIKTNLCQVGGSLKGIVGKPFS